MHHFRYNSQTALEELYKFVVTVAILQIVHPVLPLHRLSLYFL
jgi:hypothetical protein